MLLPEFSKGYVGNVFVDFILKSLLAFLYIVKYIVCARLAQLVRSLPANQEVRGSIPGLVEG